MRLTTIQDVAAHAGVSIKTVSRVANDEPNVHPETRRRVRDAIKALNYRPNPQAVFLGRLGGRRRASA